MARSNARAAAASPSMVITGKPRSATVIGKTLTTERW